METAPSLTLSGDFMAGSPQVPSFIMLCGSCCSQASTRFDRWLMSDMGMFRQLTGTLSQKRVSSNRDSRVTC